MLSRLELPDERNRFEAFIRALFAADSIEKLHQDLAEVSVPPPYHLWMKVVYATDDPLAIFDNMAEREDISRLSEHSPCFMYHARIGGIEPTDIGICFAVLPTEYRNIRVVVSISTTRAQKVLFRILHNLYPRLVPVYLSQKELIRGIFTLREEAKGFVIRVRELSAKESLDDTGNRSKSVREWTNEDLNEVLEHITARRQSISSIKLAFFKTINDRADIVPAVTAKVTKQGEATVTGRFALAWHTVIAHMADVGHRKLQFYAKRGMRDSGYRSAPLEIVFGEPIFESVEEIRSLVSILSRYPQSMHAVPHGNPYAHVLLSDNFDGSAFDIWSVTSHSIIIVPRLKATEAAIERLVHYIFERYREGEVKDYVEA